MSCHFVSDHSDVFDRSIRLKQIQNYFFFNWSYYWTSDHQTTVINVVLFVHFRWGLLSVVVEFTCRCFFTLASVTLIPSCKVFIITLLAIPIIWSINIDLSKWIKVYSVFFFTDLNNILEVLDDAWWDLYWWILCIDSIIFNLNFIRNTCACLNACLYKCLLCF